GGELRVTASAVMTPQTVLTLAQQALWITALVSAPLLLTALVVGLVVSIFQAATQINEMTLSFIPKLLAMFAALVLAGPWMLAMLVDYVQRLFTSIPQLIGCAKASPPSPLPRAGEGCPKPGEGPASTAP